MPDIEPKKEDEIKADPSEPGAEQEEEVEPDHVCGVLIRLNLEGKGVKFDPINSDEVVRQATIDDILMMCQAVVDHLKMAIIAAKVTQNIQAAQIMRKIKGGPH